MSVRPAGTHRGHLRPVRGASHTCGGLRQAGPFTHADGQLQATASRRSYATSRFEIWGRLWPFSLVAHHFADAPFVRRCVLL